MTVSMYAISVPVFTRMLTNLLAILDKAEANATDRKIDLGVLVNARLAPDMLPLRGQIQIATDHAKGCVTRLARQEVPVWADDETSYDDLRARIRKTLEVLAGINATDMDGAEDRNVTIKSRGNEVEVNGLDYLLNRAMPNFYFHVTTAYAILRHNGIPVGKSDFLG